MIIDLKRITLLCCLFFTCSIFIFECKTETQDQVLADENQTEDWPAYGRTHNERRFSPLNDIDTNTVSELKVDWYIDLPKDIALVALAIAAS